MAKKSKIRQKGEPATKPEDFLRQGFTLQQRLLLILLPVLVLVTYSHTLHSPFVFDDIRNVSSNPATHISELTFENIRMAAVESPISTRPVSYITFAINYFFHEHEVYGYRLVNMIIHMLNGLLLYFLLINTFRLPLLRDSIKQPFWIAYMTALIWVIHPLQVQSVTYIVQRMNSLATLFYMLAFICYLKARLSTFATRRWLLAGISFICGMLALGSKEIAVTLPFFILLYEWMFFQDMDFAWLKRNTIVFFATAFFLLAMLLVYLGRNPWQTIAAGYGSRDFTMWQRLLTEPRVILHYIELFVFPLPTRLTLLPEFTVSKSLVEPWTTLPAILTTWLIVSTALALAKDFRLVSFCLLWFMGNLVVESSVVSLEIIFLHRTYLPSMMASLLVTYLVLQNIRPAAAKIMLVFCLLVLGFWTYERNVTWCDKVYFWRDCLQKNPTDFRVYNNLGKALEEKGEMEVAIGMYEKAISVNPAHPRPYNNLGVVLLNTGNRDEASDVLHEAFEIAPQNPETNYNLGLVHDARNELKDAEEHYLVAHEHFSKDSDPDVHNNLGITLARQGRFKEAVGHFREAIRINNDDPFAHNNLAITLARMGENREAIIHFQHALRINPNDRLAWNNLQIVIAEQEKTGQ